MQLGCKSSTDCTLETDSSVHFKVKCTVIYCLNSQSIIIHTYRTEVVQVFISLWKFIANFLFNP